MVTCMYTEREMGGGGGGTLQIHNLVSHAHAQTEKWLHKTYLQDMWVASRGNTEYANCVQGRAGEGGRAGYKETSSANTTHGCGHTQWHYGLREGWPVCT